MSRKVKWGIVVVAAVLALYPFKTTVAPEEQVLVVTNDMHPVKDALVRQIWRNYSLEFGGHEEDLSTDAHGRVTLPQRTLRANLIWRALGPFASIAGQGVHASFGAHYHVVFVGGDRMKASNEVAVQQPGEQLYRVEL
jgi:hypothetical protein